MQSYYGCSYLYVTCGKGLLNVFSIQVGDQVLSINGIKMAGYTVQEALKLVQEAENELDLEIMYDVRDAAPPPSGSFEVHLRKTGSLNLGITINGA